MKQIEKNKKLYSLVPHKGRYAPAYITIDKAVFIDIIASINNDINNNEKKL